MIEVVLATSHLNRTEKVTSIHTDCTDALIRGSFAAVGAWCGDSGKGQVPKACRSWNENEHDKSKSNALGIKMYSVHTGSRICIMINGCL